MLVKVTLKAKETDELNEPVFLEDESIINSQRQESIFLSHFIFLLLAIIFKFATVMMFLLYFTGLLGKN